MARYIISYPGRGKQVVWTNLTDVRFDQYSVIMNSLYSGRLIRHIDIIKLGDMFQTDKVGGVSIFEGEVIYHDYYNGNVYRVSESGRITKIGTEVMLYR